MASIDEGNPPDIYMWGGDAVYVDKFEAIWLGDNEGYLPLDEVKKVFDEANTDYPYYQEMKD